MRWQASDGTVTCWLDGRITSNNAKDVEGAIRNAVAESSAKRIVLDAHDLAYISSAGLRVIIRLLKSYGDVMVANASSEVYDVFHTTGMTELVEVRRALRSVDVSHMKQIGAGACGRVYRMDAERVVKVYNSATFTPERVERERQVARQVFIHGIPSAIPFETVRVGEERGIVYELVNARNIGEVVSAEPDACAAWARRMAELARQLHVTEFEEGLLPDARNLYYNWVDRIEGTGAYAHASIAALREFVGSIPAAHTFVHGDFHPANVMVMPDGELLIIDMGDASVGHPGMDMAGSYHVMRVAARRQDGARRFCSMSSELLNEFWNVFVRAYYGVRDDADVEELERSLALVAMPRSMGTNLFTKFIGEEERARVASELERRFLAGRDSVRWDLLG